MNKTYLYVCVIFFILLVSCETSPKVQSENNIIEINVINQTNFDVRFHFFDVAKKSEAMISFPIYENELTNKIIIYYKVFLTQDVSIEIEGDRVTVSRDQKEIHIQNPTFAKTQGSYLKIINKSYNTISCINNSGSVLPSMQMKYEFAPHTETIFKITSLEELYIKDKNKKLEFNTLYFEPSYIYTYEYDGTNIVRTDIRPLHKVNEATWEMPLIGNTNTYHITSMQALKNERAYYVSGYIKNNNGKLLDMGFVVKISHEGQILWEKTTGEETGKTASIQFLHAVLTNDDSIFLVGRKTEKNNRQQLGIFEAYSSTGSLVSNKSHVMTEQGIFTRVSVDMVNDSVFIAGYEKSENTFVPYVSKWNLSKNDKHMQWKKTYEDISGELSFVSMYYNPVIEHIIMLLSTKNENDKTQQNPEHLLVLNLHGEKIHQDIIQNMYNVRNIVSDSKGHTYIAGETMSSVSRRTMAYVIKYDTQLNELWSYTAPETYSYANSIYIEEKNKEILISGALNAKDSFGNDGNAYIRALDIKTGKVIWQKIYTADDFENSTQYEVLHSIVPDAEYGYILVASAVNQFAMRTSPYRIIRTNASGLLSNDSNIIHSFENK